MHGAGVLYLGAAAVSTLACGGLSCGLRCGEELVRGGMGVEDTQLAAIPGQVVTHIADCANC